MSALTEASNHLYEECDMPYVRSQHKMFAELRSMLECSS